MNNPKETEPLLLRHQKARALLGVGNTKYWDLVKKGIVKKVELDGTSMATFASVKAAAGMSQQGA